MKFLVLGGTGYLGSKLIHELVKKNHSVVCTRRVGSDLARLRDIDKEISVIPATIDAIDAIFTYDNFDYVINMVCNYKSSNGVYQGILDANLEFPMNVLDKIVECGIENYITIGTGLPDELNMYSYSKKIFCNLGEFYTKRHKINFTELKLEMFYGADEPRNRFLPSVIEKMLLGEDVNMTSGTQHRDIIAANDVIQAIMIVIESRLNGFHSISVGTGVAPTISEIIDFIWEETGKKSIVNKGIIPMRPNEPDCVANTSDLSQLANWNPIVWKDGIKQMIEEIKDTL